MLASPGGMNETETIHSSGNRLSAQARRAGTLTIQTGEARVHAVLVRSVAVEAQLHGA